MCDWSNLVHDGVVCRIFLAPPPAILTLGSEARDPSFGPAPASGEEGPTVVGLRSDLLAPRMSEAARPAAPSPPKDDAPARRELAGNAAFSRAPCT